MIEFSYIFSIIFLFSLLVFKKFPIFSPLLPAIALRISVFIAFTFNYIFTFGFTSQLIPILFFLPILLFPLFFLSLPKETISFSDRLKNDLMKIGLIFLGFRILVAGVGFETLPIFLGEGSNGSIYFDEENKLLSTLQHGVTGIDVFIFSILLGSRRSLSYLLCWIASLILTLIYFKKSSLLNWALIVIFADYIRIASFDHQKRYFSKMKYLTIGGILSILFAVYVISLQLQLGFDDLYFYIDTIFYTIYSIFSHPLEFIIKGRVEDFLAIYEVDRSIYLLHTPLSTLGFPAFDKGPGPAIHRFLYNSEFLGGFNPTIFVESQILLVSFFPIMGLVVLALGLVSIINLRLRVKGPFSLINKYVFLSFYTTFWIDMLFAMKIFYSYLLFLPVLYLVVRLKFK